MSLHSGIDTVAVVSGGCFTKTYTMANPGNLANLYVTRGFLEDAPNITLKIIPIILSFFRRRHA